MIAALRSLVPGLVIAVAVGIVGLALAVAGPSASPQTAPKQASVAYLTLTGTCTARIAHDDQVATIGVDGTTDLDIATPYTLVAPGCTTTERKPTHE